MAEEVIFRAVAGSLKGEEFIFDEKGLCLIGRSNDCALQIPKENDMRISRRHCLIILNPPFVSVRDLNSRNGTFVNDVKLEPGVIGDKPSLPTPVDVVLKDGDVVSLGETILEFELPSQKESAPPMKLQPPQGTKVIKLARPSKTHTGTLVPKTATEDTDFFKPPTIANGGADLPPPMTELFAKPKESDPQEPSLINAASAPIVKEPMKLGGASKRPVTVAQPVSTLPAAAASLPSSAPPLKKQPIKLGGASLGAATIAQPVSSLPVPSAPAVKKPIRLGGAAQGGATIAAPTPAPPVPSAPPLKKQPIKLGGASQGAATIAQPVSSLPAASAPAVKTPISLGKPQKSTPPLTSTPPMVLGAKPKPPIQLNKSSVAQSAPAEEAPLQSAVVPAAASVSKPVATPAKKPIILNRKPKSPGAAAGSKPPMKAKAAGVKPDNIDLTEVMDVSELSDDIALSAEFIRKETRKKRVTKFKIKGSK